jgi:thiol:disulfide interchange protein DsbA
MKKFAVLFVTLLFSTMVSAIPLRFEEDKHYQVISKTASTTPVVTEYFSFYCPHCFKFEFVAKGIEKALPAGTKFEKSHVDFMRSASQETQQLLSRALIASQKLKLGHKIIDAIFDHIHTQSKPFSDINDIKALFVANGIAAEEFDNAMNSFSVKGAANKMKKAQEDLSNRQVMTGVPMFIVNNKYKIISKELRSQQDYNDLVQFLLTKKD